MRNLPIKHWSLTLFLALLSLLLLPILLPSRQAQANPPPPTPPLPVLTMLDPPYDPPEKYSPLTTLSTQSTIKTFQAVADAEVRQSNPTANYGIVPTMSIGYDAAFQNTMIGRALLHFDVSSFLPPGTTVHQATLRLYLAGYCDTVSGTRTLQTYRLTQDWSELTVTWNNQPPFAEGYGSTMVPNPNPISEPSWYTFDMTALVQAWLNGTYLEHGVMIRGPETAPQCASRIFRTKGGGGFTSAPELVVDYTAPTPALATSANSLTFFHQCGVGGTAPTSQTLSLQSNEATLKDWTASVTGNSGWLTLSKSSGKVSRIFPDQIQIAVSETAPCPGTVTAQIQVNAPGLGGSPQIINITLQQSSEALLIVSPTKLIFQHQCGSSTPPPQTIIIQSNNAALNNWTANVSSGAGWLNLSKSSGQVSNTTPDQIEVSVNEASPCPSDVTAQIQINVPNLGNSPQTINITLQRNAPPTYLVYLPLVVKGNLGQTAATQLVNTTSAISPVNSIALIVGVADYQYLGPPNTFAMLRGGVWGFDILAGRADGREILIFLRGDFQTVIALTEENATKENIDYALQWIDEREGPDTRVLIYFSGHGGPINDQPPLDETDQTDELLGVYDTNDVPQFVDYVLDDNFKNQLADLETQHLALIVDACNSGGMEVTNTNRAVLAASREDQNSWESSELEHGVFTYYMLQAMLDPASDTNGDGWLSVQEIYNYARDPVDNYVMSNQGVNQSLVLTSTIDVNVKRIP